MIWSFALAPDGSLHIIDGELPSAENVVALELQDRGGGLWVINEASLTPLRALLGQPSVREVIRHSDPQVADELEDALQRITADMQRRIDELRGDAPTH